MQYHFDKESRIPSPALVYYKDAIRKNTEETIRMAGCADRLWPHVKTHKMTEMIRMQVEMGIVRFKCATAAEIRMTAEAGAEHIVWAYPLVGPNIDLYFDLCRAYPDCMIYALADDFAAAERFSKAAVEQYMPAHLLLDVNMGMNRTGIALNDVADFYRRAAALPGVLLYGLHCYDGHIHDNDFADRVAHAETAAKTAFGLREELMNAGYNAEIMIMGGTPTMPCHALSENVFLSPGTLFVSDHGYNKNFPDIKVTPAAAVLTRVISHPAEDLFTLDTGVKAISADANPRGILVGFEEYCEPVLSSEEHWVFRMKPEHLDKRPAIGDVLYAIPTHICPTTAMYDAVYVCEGGKLVDIWKVTARDRVGALTVADFE